MAIRGSLTEASLPDVLQLLAMGRKTGCLALTQGNEFGYIYFDDGRISHASILNRPLSTEESVYLLFTWSQGTFSFEPGITPEEGVRRVSIDPQAVLLEGARRVDEWTLVAKKIPSLDIVFAVDRHRLLENEQELTPEQHVLLPLINGQRDVSAIVAESGLGEFEVGRALYGLLNAAFIERIGVSARTPRPISPAERALEHRTLGVAQYKAGMYDEAEREFRLIEGLAADDPVAWFYLGLIALRRGQWPEATEALERSAARSMPRASLYVNLAYSYERQGDLQRAREVMHAALVHGGRSDPLVQTNAAALAVAGRDHIAAELALAAARGLWGTRLPPPVWYHYAALNAALANDLDRAITLLLEAVNMYPSVAVLWNNLAVAYEAKGDIEHALQILERGMATDPALPQLYRNVADCLQRAGRLDEAYVAYQRAQAVQAQAT